MLTMSYDTSLARNDTKRFRVAQNDSGRRFDRIARRLLPQLSLSEIYRCIRKGQVRLNDKTAFPSTRANLGDEISVRFALEKRPVAQFSEVRSEIASGFGALILFENDHVLALNKPAGIPVHGSGSLDEQVKAYLNPKIAPSLSYRPGPVHRLDRNTSGLVLFAVSACAARGLSMAFKEGLLAKYYLAVLEGSLRYPQRWSEGLARDSRARKTFLSSGVQAKLCTTKVTPVVQARNQTLAVCQPLTGRTHQIRAQAAIHGHPLAGDMKYGGKKSLPYYILHSACIVLRSGVPSLGLPALRASLPPGTERELESRFGAKVGLTVGKLLADLTEQREC